MTTAVLDLQSEGRSGSWLQWSQLLLLSMIHFWADLYMGMIPSLMPRIRSVFDITVIMGIALMIAPTMVVNLVQLVIGHIRPGKAMPLLIYIGGVLAVFGSGLSLITSSGVPAFNLVMALFCVSALGVGMVHPESFRAVHALDRVSPAMGTAIFMIGGQLGYGMGAWIATMVVTRWDFPGLWSLVPVMALLMILTFLMRIRLAVEPAQNVEVKSEVKGSIPFWPVWFMNLPAAFGVLAFLSLLPQYLNEKGFELEFGGYCNWLFMAGSVAGCLFWSALSHRVHPILCSVLSFGFGAPFIAVYAWLAHYRQASWLLVPAGFCLMAAFTLLVKEARFARGLNLGTRMALSAGGTWGFSNLVFLIVSYFIKEIWSSQTLIFVGIHYSWLAFIPSIILGLWVWGLAIKLQKVSEKNE